MKFWQSVHGVEPEQLIDIAKLADRLGFEGITCGDHLVKPADYGKSYLYSEDGRPPWDPGPDWTPPYADPWILGAVLSQATTRLRFMPYVYVLPMRDPVMVAKQTATAAFFSNDRIVMGVGSGWLEEEFRLVGADWKTRGARMDEMLEVIALLHGGRDVEFRGRHYTLPACRMRPVPRRRVPVMIGGHSDAALRRAARHDGWLGVDYAFDDLVPIVKKLLALRCEAVDAGRCAAGAETGPFEVFAVLKRFPDLDGLRRMADLGVTMTQDYAWFYKGEHTSTLERKRETMERFAEETIEAFARARG
ncbi:MAG: TIGR03619 family F420-dependent LLM class oxidoreductase [Myxococcota bacterium]